jgi:hypothetical protein
MDVEKTIQFILEQQARFMTDLAELRAVVLDLANTQEKTNEIVAVLAERQVATEENLNSLIATVERHIAGHN